MEQQLLTAMRLNPGASASALAGLLGVGKGAIVSRWRGLDRRRLIEKANSRSWVVAAEPIEAGSKLQPDEGPFPRWVKPIGAYARRESAHADDNASYG